MLAVKSNDKCQLFHTGGCKMLVSFSLENWMSFKHRTTFSMIASRERQHGERVPRVKKYQTRVLPIAALYGANASGKTNFFKALSFAKKLVVTGSRPDTLIPVEPFRLDDTMASKPSVFEFELLIDQDIYEYSFAVTRKEVLQERLVLITSTSERVLYHRQGDAIEFEPALGKNPYLNFTFRGTRENQLYLTNSISQKIDTFKVVHDWFKDTLELIAPDSRFRPFDQFIDVTHQNYPAMNEALRQLDTGILHLGGEEVPFEHINLPESVKAKFQEEVKEGMTVRVFDGLNDERFIITRKNDILKIQKLVTYHQGHDKSEVKFEMYQESDGTQRIIDLLPSFLNLSAQDTPKVYVIDEIGRSLHTLLIRRLIESYLFTCSQQSKNQLLLTTHDVLLMDQKLLRRDEMWVAERNGNGVSTLIPFSDYKDIRYDKDIQKSYLQGRLGGIPRILLGEALTPPCTPDKKMENR